MPLRELADLPLILPRAQHWIWRRLASAAFRRGVRIEPAFQADSLALTKEMVRSTLGCTVLPCVAIRDELARGTLVFRPIEQPSLSATHAIAFRQTTAEPLIRGFAVVIRDVMKTLATDGTWIGARIVRTEIAPGRRCRDIGDRRLAGAGRGGFALRAGTGRRLTTGLAAH